MSPEMDSRLPQPFVGRERAGDTVVDVREIDTDRLAKTPFRG